MALQAERCPSGQPVVLLHSSGNFPSLMHLPAWSSLPRWGLQSRCHPWKVHASRLNAKEPAKAVREEDADPGVPLPLHFITHTKLYVNSCPMW